MRIGEIMNKFQKNWSDFKRDKRVKAVKYQLKCILWALIIIVVIIMACGLVNY